MREVNALATLVLYLVGSYWILDYLFTGRRPHDNTYFCKSIRLKPWDRMSPSNS